MTVEIFGYQFGRAGSDGSTAYGPAVIQSSIYLERLQSVFEWRAMIDVQGHASQHAALADAKHCCDALAQLIHQCQNPFVVLGGDHSSAIGTIQGAQKKSKNPLKLLWVDAHMDAHTFETSESQNIHGMPIAVALGEASAPLSTLYDPSLYLQPENICMVGIRAYEPAEKKRLEKLGVRIFYMDEVEQLGIEACLQQALQYLNPTQKNQLLVSIDLDAFCPEDAPGVTVPEPHGITANHFLQAVDALRPTLLPYLTGIEVVEFSPKNDLQNRTERLILQLIDRFFAPHSQQAL